MQKKTPSASTLEEPQFMKTAGLRVRYRVRGDGPALLMINGIGLPLEFWRPLEARLGRFRTITVDPPGSGHSSVPRGRFGVREHAGVIDDLLEHLGIDSAGVLGLAFGGMVAQELARRSPGRVERLALASTNCGLGGMPSPPRALTAVFNPVSFYSPAYFRKVAPLIYGEGIVDDPALLDEHLEIRRDCRPSLRGHVVQLRAAFEWTSRPWLRHLPMPVLVIAGSDDRLVPTVKAGSSPRPSLTAAWRSSTGAATCACSRRPPGRRSSSGTSSMRTEPAVPCDTAHLFHGLRACVQPRACQ
ncbi:alpha/beta fold hydrolase [Rhodococcus aetherivorans]